jgi:hypothetical protein
LKTLTRVLTTYAEVKNSTYVTTLLRGEPGNLAHMPANTHNSVNLLTNSGTNGEKITFYIM